MGNGNGRAQGGGDMQQMQMMQMMQQMMQQMMAQQGGNRPGNAVANRGQQRGSNMPGNAKRKSGQEGNDTPKNILNIAHARATGNHERQNFSYETYAVTEGAVPEQYQSLLTIDGDQQIAGEIAGSKKVAEQNAALAAIKALYPADAGQATNAARNASKATNAARNASKVSLNASKVSLNAKQKGQLGRMAQAQSQAQSKRGGQKKVKEVGWDRASPKSMLNDAHFKATGNRASDDISYETAEVDGNGMHQSTMTIASCGAQFCGEPAQGKAKAEQHAAQAALKDLYPQCRPANNGKKVREGESPKSVLHQVHGKATGTVDKPEYETSEVAADGTYQSTITIDGVEHCGEPAQGKREAEQNAARAALKALYPQQKVPKAPKGDTKKQEERKKRDNGKKREREARETPADLTSRDRILRLITFQEGGNSSKDCFQASYENAGNGVVATVSIPALNATCEGTGANQKAAQTAALEAFAKRPEIAAQLDAADEQAADRKRAKAEEKEARRVAKEQIGKL